MYIGEEMPDLSLKLPNLTAEISWSLRMRDSIDDIVGSGSKELRSERSGSFSSQLNKRKGFKAEETSP